MRAPACAGTVTLQRERRLSAVGTSGACCVRAAQAAGALAHVAGTRDGAAALLQAHGTRAALPQLLACATDEVSLAAAMALAGVCSHGDAALLDKVRIQAPGSCVQDFTLRACRVEAGPKVWLLAAHRAVPQVTNTTEIMAGLHVALSRPHAHTASYAALCMANLAMHPPAQHAVLLPGTLARLAVLVTSPLLPSPPVLTLPPGAAWGPIQPAANHPLGASLPKRSSLGPGTSRLNLTGGAGGGGAGALASGRLVPPILGGRRGAGPLGVWPSLAGLAQQSRLGAEAATSAVAASGAAGEGGVLFSRLSPA